MQWKQAMRKSVSAVRGISAAAPRLTWLGAAILAGLTCLPLLIAVLLL